ncbi:MAG: hypothetical protein A3F54_00925 [Candidatus Kerfeldbacteria bacterium RIFCSPHIGHO2_12_FULL_48_17]|uniref:Uncharacterized protein n=1 Tax=Candidatus Kerfeldbacteria bacterium RIFCSPHIGHO2_12_FULL_48_17 TaxID=1798542 RepID=A0A1G2B4J8_9BACT|nr:MAG: hypothetical protein A3F54_00925 [Candidatus Kerfeldbacteria bacterium RIFCSPHIGHO2_12_FULL_48_17]
MPSEKRLQVEHVSQEKFVHLFLQQYVTQNGTILDRVSNVQNMTILTFERSFFFNDRSCMMTNLRSE